MDVLSWSAWTGNIIALGGIAYTWWTGRGAKQAASEAGRRADKSLAAAQEAAAAQQRMADVLEKIYEERERRATESLRSPTAPAAPATPSAPSEETAMPWLLQRTSDGAYRLANAGAVTLHDVRITVSDAVRVEPPPLPQDTDWSPGASAEFRAAVSWSTGTPQIVVRWRDAVGHESRWERVIPR